MTSTSIDNDEFKTFLFEHLYTFLGNYHGIDFGVTSVKGNSSLRRILFNLIVGSRTKSIGTYET